MANRLKFDPIAVVGLACWYPDARSPKELWENILARRIQFRRYLDQRLPIADYHHPDRGAPDKTYGSRAAYIDGYAFDWASHRIPLSAFKSMDVAHWLALDVALLSIEDAGYTRETLPNEKTGVLLGNTLTGEQSRAGVMRLRWPFIKRTFTAALQSQGVAIGQINSLLETAERYYKSVFPPVNEDTLAGGLSNTIAGRICNYLNLNGGGYTIDGACSSSLLAVANAAAYLASGELDLALAGGVDISLDPFEIVGFSKTSALTMTEMTVYDRRGSGFIPGEGCGFVVLKRLEDARRDGDYIYAVIHGWGISSDGGGTGLTAPSAQGQARSIRRAYEKAPYDMDSLSFIEGHGTGTVVGDRVELTAISLAMEKAAHTMTGRSCGVTSLKSIIGHTKAASGIGAFIKAVVAVNRRVLPPTASCKEPHQIFGDKALQLFPILQGEIHEPEKKLRAGASSMGFGGINCHITVESEGEPSPKLTPDLAERALLVTSQETEIFIFSDNDPRTLKKRIKELLLYSHALSQAELTDLSCKLIHEVDPGARYRAAVVAGSPVELTKSLQELLTLLKEMRDTDSRINSNASKTVIVGRPIAAARLGMIFPGQGSQKMNMARRLVQRFPWAARMLDEADECLLSLKAMPVSKTIFHPLEKAPGPVAAELWFRDLSQTENSQPAICTASAIWFEYLKKLAIKPAVLGGHSMGELTAFYAAGAYSFSELIKLSAIRGRAMAAADENAGTMASLRCSQEIVEELLAKASDYVVLANINGPEQMVISGSKAGVNQVCELAEKRQISIHRLQVSNAFHSRMSQKASEVLANLDILPEKSRSLEARLFSGMQGIEITAAIDLKEHFSRQVISQVDFVSMINSISRLSDIFIEVGPGRVLSGLINNINEKSGPRCWPVEALPEQDRDLNQLLALLWTQGVEIAWENLFTERLARRFIPPGERTFIDNPCERPFAPDETSTEYVSVPPSGLIEQVLLDSAFLSEEELRSYLTARGAFLAEVIKADIKHPGAEAILREFKAVPPAREVKEKKREIVSPHESTKTALFTLLQEMTGFPRESLSGKMKLLDDLNMDSIKAGDLIARLSAKTGVKVDLKALNLNNASLDEVAATFSSRLPEAAPPESAEERPDMTGLVFATIQEITGYPPESLNISMKLLDDLNMDSIKAGDLIIRLLQKANVPLEQLDPRTLANASLEEISEALKAISGQALAMATPAITAAPLLPPGRTWVREFTVSYREAELPDDHKEREKWRSANLLILADAESEDIASALGAALSRMGAQLKIAGFEEAKSEKLTQNINFSHFIAILPRKPSLNLPSNKEELQQTISRLASLSNIPSSLQRPATMAYVQFGEGRFGRTGHASDYTTCCAAALAKSIHLERNDIKVRVVDFCSDANPGKVAHKIICELQTPESFAEAGYDAYFTRRVSVQTISEPVAYRDRNIEWSGEDVILVTGGARGITASCAFDLASKTGARMALLGRTPAPEAHTGDEEVRRWLRRYKEAGLTARYYACDVVEISAVKDVVAKIESEMGAITGVIHGAGLNVPRPCQEVTAEQALQEVGPKVLGAMNLLEALENNKIKIIAAMNSIIGVTGMQGNAWYGFSNEVLDLLLRRYRVRRQETQIISVAYSIWGEEGMGFRMGSVGLLKHQGIDSIPSEEGIQRWTRLCLQDPGAPLVIVSARLGGLDTFNIPSLPGPAEARYLEKPLYVAPSVESVFQAHLTLETDPYLIDHDFNGSYLFPTVFGLEAMAQAVAHVTGLQKISGIRIENIKLQRPITVDAQEGADIVIRALALEKKDETQIVQAWVSRAGSSEGEDYFSARFVLEKLPPAPPYLLEKPSLPLTLQPTVDLYREGLMFQGPRFQRIQKLWRLDAEGKEARKAIFETYIATTEKTMGDAYNLPEKMTFLLGDPFYRDTLLQSAQLLLPMESSLPVSIARWDIYPESDKAPVSVLANVDLQDRREKDFDAEVVALDRQGRLREKIETYTLYILQHRPESASASELLAPTERDEKIIARIIKEASDVMEFEAPALAVSYLPGIHSMKKEERHALEAPLMQETLKKALPEGLETTTPYEIQWLESGKPVIPALKDFNIDISLSHDDRFCLCCAAEGLQGIDVAPVTSRNRTQWLALLGGEHSDLLESLEKAGDSLDAAGTRLWATLEALRKMGEFTVGPSSVENRIKDVVLFRAGTASKPVRILTFPVYLTWGPSRMIALIVRSKAAEISEVPPPPGFEELFEQHHVKLMTGPQGQNSIAIRIPVTFRPSAQLSRTVYFSNYLFWAGDIRETAIWPILRQVGEQFTTGKWGSVTNNSRLRIVGEATAQDQIELRMWVDDNRGPTNSTMDLKFDFLKVLPKDQYERLAWCEQTVTWVKILDHGVVAAEAYPEYYENYMRKMMPQNDNPRALPPYPESLQSLYKDKPEPLIYSSPPGPTIKPVLHEQAIETSLDHSNLVGNIYFANYYLWQGTVRDRYFYGVIPEYYRGEGQRGELLCLESRINHLREAMPFDRIVVTMALKTLTACNATFYFEYFRQDPDNTRTKLAYGEQDAVWVMRDKKRVPYASPFPEKALEAFQKAAR